MTSVISLPERSYTPPPAHVAIIMDGNGRWARARGLPRAAGHKRGADAVRRAVEAAHRRGVRYLTLFAFSSENWRRPTTEIVDLMGLLRHYLNAEIDYLEDNDVRLRVIGDRERLAPDIVDLIDKAERRTAANQTLTLVIALSYGGRAEIVGAARRLAAQAADGLLDPRTIDEATLTANLFTAGIPDPDLLIRTSGEKRISNFLIWQLAYAEFMFIDTLWPDFTAKEFDMALVEFQRRERRYGRVQP